MADANLSDNAPPTITRQLQSINQDSFATELDRKLAVHEVQALLSRIETPFETAWRLTWFEPSVIAVLRTACSLDLFARWKEQGGQALKLEALEKIVEADPALLGRILRHLAASGILRFSSTGEYMLTPFSSALSDKEFTRNVDDMYQWHVETYAKLPSYLAQNNYLNPSDPVNTNWKGIKGMPIMDSVQADPNVAAVISSAMRLSRTFRGNFVALYPAERLIADSNDSSKLLVDIGGSLGHDSTAFLAKHPEAKGRIVLQDLPQVVAQAIDLDAGIEKMPHDFFTLQPVQGAAAYYLHSVLHDWPDIQARKILECLKPALKKGYSKLLIQDIIIDIRNPRPETTTSDITMLNIASAQERTDEAWKDLLTSSGFVIRDIFHNPLYADSVIEAELA